MSKNAILVLANNLDFFRLMINNLPEYAREYQFIIVNETRLGDKTKEIKNIMKDSGMKKFKIFPSEFITNTFKEEIYDNEFVDNYCMSMNILSLWFVMNHNRTIEKLLLLDDDVILREGFENVFENKNSSFKYFRLSAGPAKYEGLSKNAKNNFDEWFRIFNMNFEKEEDKKEWYEKEYLHKYENSGQRMIVRKDIDIRDYEQSLIRFFDSDRFFDLWINRRVYTSYFFDEMFELFFFFNIMNDNLKRDVSLLISKPEKIHDKSFKFLNKYHIIHNATKSHKKDIYNLMIDAKFIMGDKIC